MYVQRKHHFSACENTSFRPTGYVCMCNERTSFRPADRRRLRAGALDRSPGRPARSPGRACGRRREKGEKWERKERKEKESGQTSVAGKSANSWSMINFNIYYYLYICILVKPPISEAGKSANSRSTINFNIFYYLYICILGILPITYILKHDYWIKKPVKRLTSQVHTYCIT